MTPRDTGPPKPRASVQQVKLSMSPPLSLVQNPIGGPLAFTQEIYIAFCTGTFTTRLYSITTAALDVISLFLWLSVQVHLLPGYVV